VIAIPVHDALEPLLKTTAICVAILAAGFGGARLLAAWCVRRRRK
jgi:hypothetical protein